MQRLNKSKECKVCNANPIVCQYCSYRNGDIEDEVFEENIVYFNNIKDDNKSKKFCPICKKIYTEYPALSRKDNKTLICSACGMKEIVEPFEEILYENGIDVIKDF